MGQIPTVQRALLPNAVTWDFELSTVPLDKTAWLVATRLLLKVIK